MREEKFPKQKNFTFDNDTETLNSLETTLCDHGSNTAIINHRESRENLSEELSHNYKKQVYKYEK